MVMEIGTTPVSIKNFSAREANMSISRLFSWLVTVVLIVLGIFTIRAGIATSEVASNEQDLSDYFQRHPGVQPLALQLPAPARTSVLEQGSRFDRAQPIARPEASNRTMVLEQGSRYDRTQASARPTSLNAIVASDWFERHSASIKSVNAADLSDYFQRHPDTTIMNAAEAGASDWFERHPQIMNPGNAADLSDYYQRHPGVGLD
jgi:hypothetical protein